MRSDEDEDEDAAVFGVQGEEGEVEGVQRRSWIREAVRCKERR